MNGSFNERTGNEVVREWVASGTARSGRCEGIYQVATDRGLDLHFIFYFSRNQDASDVAPRGQGHITSTGTKRTSSTECRDEWAFESEFKLTRLLATCVGSRLVPPSCLLILATVFDHAVGVHSFTGHSLALLRLMLRVIEALILYPVVNM